MGTDKFFSNSKIQRLIGNNMRVKKIRITRRQEAERSYSYLRTPQGFSLTCWATATNPNRPLPPPLCRDEETVGLSSPGLPILFGHLPPNPYPTPQRKEEGEVPRKMWFGRNEGPFPEPGGTLKEAHDGPNAAKKGQSLKAR